MCGVRCAVSPSPLNTTVPRPKPSRPQESDGNDKFLGQVSLFTHDMGSLPKYYDPMTLEAHGEDRLTRPYVRVRTGKDNAVRTDTRIEKHTADGNQ